MSINCRCPYFAVVDAIRLLGTYFCRRRCNTAETIIIKCTTILYRFHNTINIETLKPSDKR